MADLIFKDVTAIKLPEGFVKEIKDSDGNLLWKSNKTKWVLKEAEKETIIETRAYTSRMITTYSTINVDGKGNITLSNSWTASATGFNASYPYYKSSSGVICRRKRGGVTSGTGTSRLIAVYGYIITAVEE